MTLQTGDERALLEGMLDRQRDAIAHLLDERFAWRERVVSLRFILGHMIAELARHAGHGDILVEQIRARR